MSVKIFGVGSSGIRALGKMINELGRGISTIAVDTDAEALRKSRATKKIQLETHAIHQVGTAGMWTLGKQAAIKHADELRMVMTGASKLFVVGGFGGGTATGAVPIIAEIAFQAGFAPTVIVTMPFTFEGTFRSEIAQQGMAALSQVGITPIVVELDQILPFEESQPDILRLYALADSVIAWQVLSRCVP